MTACISPSRAADPARVVAVGDLHGDYSAWLDIARDARLIDGDGRWAGGNTILVQLGDITDRGPDSLKIIRSLQQLQAEAPRAGGQVVVLLGNHEAMNVIGDLRYVHAGEYAAFVDERSPARRERVYAASRRQLEAQARASNPSASPSQVRDAWLARTPLGWVEHRAAWAPTGELGKWAAGLPAVARIGDTLFAHGGISAEYAKLPIEEINRRVAAAMRTATEGPSSVLEDPLGPLWYRGLVMRDTNAIAARAGATPMSAEEELDTVLKAYGAKRLVVGHTPNPKGVVTSADGRLVRADTAISRYYGGTLAWVEIVGDRVISHSVQRSAP
ncbi:MAG TPA: metallophosphoesterase [Sphingomicrobium sp.]|nr:metallophosphoesterase [Sphingomicrobium sp.]